MAGSASLLQLQHDASKLQMLLQSPEWGVLQRYLEDMQQKALARMMNPMSTDQDTHHWRGVYTAITDLLALPERVIEQAHKL